MIPLPFEKGGPSEGGSSGQAKKDTCNKLFDELSPRYENAAKIVTLHKSMHRPGGKILRNSNILFGISKTRKRSAVQIDAPTNLNLEVFIPEEIEKMIEEYIAIKFPNGFIFKHTTPEYHPVHNWDPETWIMKNLDNELPIFEADSSPWKDINAAFAMARKATHRVLSSSVFVHACDAMDATMDVVYYGKPNPHGLPIEPGKILENRGCHAT